MNKKIRVFRPAFVASLVGFGGGISIAKKPHWADYGFSYFMTSLVVGIVFSVMAFVIVLAWQGIRRYLSKPREDEVPKKSKLGLFTAIVSDEDALAAIKVAGMLIIVISGYSFAIRLFVGNIGIVILDVVLIIGLAVIVFCLKSRVAAAGLLLLSVISAFATGHNRIIGGDGGANLFMALLIVWSSLRLVIATFRLQSNRTSEQ